MKHLKKALVVVLAVLMMISATGCGDVTWSFKTDYTTVSIGTYIFYEYSAMYEASTSVSDSDAQILEQKIDDIPAEEWVNDKTMESIKNYLAVEKLMHDMKLEVSAEDKSTAENYAKYLWQSYGKEFEEYGISYESYYNANLLHNAKNETVFKAIYDKDGTKAVSDDELKKYFTDNYSDYYYFTYNLSKKNDKEETEAFTEDETATVKKQFDSYVKMMNKQKKSYSDVVEAFLEYSKQESSAEEGGDITESSPSTHHTAILDDTSMLDESVREKVKAMKENTAEAFIDGEGTSAVYYFVYKTSIEDRSKEFLADNSQRLSVLQTMKKTEYEDYIKDVIKGITFETNEKAIKKYPPKMFEEEFLN